MPLLFQRELHAPGEWGLWRIAESESELLDRVPLFSHEREGLNRIKGTERRKEYLAARLLLHRMSGRTQRAELVKDTYGKPALPDSPFHVSISHTRGYSAAIAHPRPCGVDVQRIVPQIHRLSHKFVSAAERGCMARNEEQERWQLHFIWSAKEAIYKAYGKRQLDFCRDMFVDVRSCTARLTIRGMRHQFALTFRRYDDFVLVGAVQK